MHNFVAVFVCLILCLFDCFCCCCFGLFLRCFVVCLGFYFNLFFLFWGGGLHRYSLIRLIAMTKKGCNNNKMSTP